VPPVGTRRGRALRDDAAGLASRKLTLSFLKNTVSSRSARKYT
jgi:hypothetical protein